MPPPNITGKLHMGHAMFSTLQDILIRHNRMKGKNTLWQAGFDHAGLATQKKLDEEMTNLGLDLEKDFHWFSNEYKNNLKNTIENQLRRTGASCDWSRSRFTLDDDYSKSVKHAFSICEEKGMLYKDNDNWYLDMEDLANRLLSSMDAGELTIQPASEEKVLRHYLNNIEPWCISRQIKWGHPIPMEGEDDVLDTWFSSALWPFAILGWPDKTNDINTFYPAAIIETADDILFFWCARMLMMGLLLTDRLPFNTIYLHGIIRDKNGDKMSKSLNNGVDPIDLIESYGCDGMRMGIVSGSVAGQDTKLNTQKLQSGKATAHKLWSIARFSLPLLEAGEITNPIDISTIKHLKRRIGGIHKNIDDLEFHTACHNLREILFDDISSGYISNNHSRLVGGDKSGSATLDEILTLILKASHPFMPFTSEEIWGRIHDDMLIDQKY